MQLLKHQTKIIGKPVEIASAIVLGIVLGILSAWLSPVLTIFLITAITFILLGFQKPEYSIVLIIAVLCTIYPEENMPRISIGFGRLYLSEFVAVGMFLLLLARWLSEKDFHLRNSPLNIPLLLFYIWSSGVAIIWMLNGEVDKAVLVSEVRIITYYLLFFLVANLLRTRSSISNLVDAFFILATVVALAMIAQYVLGSKVSFLPGRVETLVTEGEEYSNVTRIVDTVGEGSIIAAFTAQTILLMTRSWSWKPKRLVEFVQWILLGVGVVLTFSRTIWVVILFGVIIAALVIGLREKIKMIKWAMSLVYLSPLLVIYLLINPGSSFGNLIIVSLERFGSLADSSAYSTSQTSLSTFRWRDFEYSYSVPAVMNNPITGIGLGAEYRPLVAGINEPTDTAGFDGRTYTHNGHMWIAMKTGLVGYFLFAWFSIVFISRSFKYWNKIPDEKMKRVVLGFAVCYIAVLIGSITHPMIMTLYWTPVLGMMLGINEAIIQLYLPKMQQV